MTTKTNRTTTQAHDAKVIGGIQKDLASFTQIPLGTTIFTPASLTAFYQSRIDGANKVATTRAAWLDAIAAYDALYTKGQVIDNGLKHFVYGAFGNTAPQLADFGYEPPKTATQTPEQKVAAVAKRAATRKARGTLGPVAKLAITGETAAKAAAANPATTAPATPPTPGQPPAPVPTKQ